MECIKNCCKRLAEKRWKAPEETQGVAVQIPVGGAGAPNRWGVDEDYLLSRMPADGKEVPFVLPTLKASYVQPGASTYVDPQYGMPGPARWVYAQRKAELRAPAAGPQGASSSQSPRDAGRNKNCSGGGERLSRSMFELDSSYGASLKSFDSTSSVLSTPASVTDSIKSSTESFPQSGDDLGRLCVRLSYREELEQVWITLVQCSELNLPVNPAQKPKIRIKGVITLPKPVHFKTSVQEYSQDATFMETFVFALSLQSLRRGALRLSLQTRGARKRTAAQCVLSLRQLGPRETERWLRLGSPGKSSAGGCELHLATCFQPVSRRLQVRVLAAQNLPAGSSPLPPAYAAHVEMRAPERPPDKRKTRALKAHAGRCQWDATFYLELDALHPAACALAVKLFSCGSVNRKQCVGQVQLGSDAPTQEAAEQWKETVEYPEKVVAAWHAVT
ncbi:tandem C2 domains nuclear protein isoform X1 [Syngnathoides biaculeatus]|uniref:tandem C2 domains nuclear protein isoform X1 n=1 Tax=Syngnathoides biaculeatus TaxID=300417 RepID=UPI002ADD599C|nr:tandem C2 domains nuclear protein isoform X1 [Syngnathoides biaculeatus]